MRCSRCGRLVLTNSDVPLAGWLDMVDVVKFVCSTCHLATAQLWPVSILAFCPTCAEDGSKTRLHNGACWLHGTPLPGLLRGLT